MSASVALPGVKITLAVTAAFFSVGLSTSSVPNSVSKTPSSTGPLGPRYVVQAEEWAGNESSISVPGASLSGSLDRASASWWFALYMYNVLLRNMCDVKSRGVTQVEKGHAGNTAVVTAYFGETWSMGCCIARTD